MDAQPGSWLIFNGEKIFQVYGALASSDFRPNPWNIASVKLAFGAEGKGVLLEIVDPHKRPIYFLSQDDWYTVVQHLGSNEYVARTLKAWEASGRHPFEHRCKIRGFTPRYHLVFERFQSLGRPLFCPADATVIFVLESPTFIGGGRRSGMIATWSANLYPSSGLSWVGFFAQEEEIVWEIGSPS